MLKRKSLLIGASSVLVIGAISLVSVLTGGNPGKKSGTPVSELVGKHMKDFSLGGLNGGTIRAPWESGHPTVLGFFASYCGPCQGEMPQIAKYIRLHSPSPVVVLAIDAIDARSSAQAMMKRDNVTFPVAFDPNGIVTTHLFGFSALPESVFLNSKGVVDKVYYGAIPKQQLAKGIQMLRMQPS
jgi:thiol-disulfide isomerase/thioredoxin